MKRIAIPVLVAAIALAGAAGTSAAAVTRIRPHQFFTGFINGRAPTSLISVTGCTAAGGDGHPLAGQSAEVRQIVPSTAVPPGFTGRATRIAADLEVPASDPMLPLIRIIHLGVLQSYNTPLAISPGLMLPCQGQATAVFAPVNGGAKAVEATVRVTFVSPKIVVGPTVVSTSTGLRPGTVVHLTGSGFAPNASYNVVECSQTSWLVTQNPCPANNGIDVTTGPDGAFGHAFTVQACILVPTPTVNETCYIGVPMISGIDTVQLVAPAKITVTLRPPAS